MPFVWLMSKLVELEWKEERVGNGRDVFKRLEKKYLLDCFQRNSVMDALACSHRVDAYGTSTVTSLYFDTDRFNLIERSLEKPLYKEKLRLRAYGADEGALLLHMFTDCGEQRRVIFAARTLPVFLEIKTKYDGVVYKRRIALPLEAARAYLEGVPYEKVKRLLCWTDFADPLEQSQKRTAQIVAEIDALMNRHGLLTPSVMIACERTALEPLETALSERKELRVTFDEGVRALNLRQSNPVWFPVLDRHTQLMEVKNSGALDITFARLLSQENLYPCSFSKYGNAYRILQRQSQGCLQNHQQTHRQQHSQDYSHQEKGEYCA